ncbi:MAG TPA: hypothetical protein VHG08_21410 [Longimicrobium sp.]|nr:hypothetical protein [Longimicrobium sp.]
MRRSLLHRGAWALLALAVAAAGVWIGRARAAPSPYREGREALNRGDYRRAAELLSGAASRESGADAHYWRAVALERAGDARSALAAVRLYRPSRPPSALAGDAALLEARLCAAVADDPECARARPPAADCGIVPLLAARLQSHPRETLDVIARLLASGGCDERTRRELVLLAGSAGTPEAAAVLVDAIRREPASGAGVQAILLLADAGGAPADSLLDSLVRTTPADEVRKAASEALSDRGATGAERLRRLIVDPAAPEAARLEAILPFAENTDPAAASAFLRDLYPRLETTRLQGAVVRALGYVPIPENRAWLAARALEPGVLRDTALAALGVSRAGRADLLQLYGRTADRDLKLRLLRLYADEEGAAEVERLRTIAAADPDPQLRAEAARLLRDIDDEP